MNLIKKFKNLDKYSRYSIIVIILFSIIVFSLASIHHVSGDGCWHAQASKLIAKSGKFPLFDPIGRDWPFFSPPLYHIFDAIVYYFFSFIGNETANFAIKFVSPIFGILSLSSSFIIVKKLVNSKIAFYSSIFIAFVPIFIDYSYLSYVESMLSFFVILSVYFMLKGKIFLAGFSFALASLTKYNALFALPLLLFIVYKNSNDKKMFLRKSSIIIGIFIVVALPWYIRNWILLGNPIWPFLNLFFNGFQPESQFESPPKDQLNFLNVVDPNFYLTSYLGIFGVPNGNYKLLTFFDIPHLKIFLAIWMFGTLIFIIPMIAGLFNKKIENKGIFVVWITSFLVVVFLYAINSNLSAIRFMLPAFPALAVLWAYGFDALKSKFKILTFLFVLIIIGFSITEFFKVKLSANAWHFYQKDFDWVKLNTEKNIIFASNNGQCIPYNIARVALNPSEKNIKKADYIWINDGFKMDRVLSYNPEILKNYNLIYSNNQTGTRIYKLSTTH